MNLCTFILFTMIPLCSFTTQACINTYAFEIGRAEYSQESAQDEIKKHSMRFKNVQERNDYGVLLIYAHRYQQAIEIFKQIEKQHPNLAKTAANLGTAYELAGQTEKAKYWIEQGIKRDPNIHEGSEWIHVKILDAQLQQKKDSKWIQKHDVLGLDFGQKSKPTAKIKTVHFQANHYDLDQVLAHSQIQMNQRLKFVKRDPISAQIVFNMANIEMINFNTDLDTVDVLYERALHLGYTQPKLIESRLDYFNHSKWFRFQAFFVRIFDAFIQIFA